jgi:hypothetical protein
MVRDAYGFALSYKHQGDRQVEETRQQFQSLYHPLLVALVWRGYVRSALAARDEHPDRVLLIDFDEATRDSAPALDRVQRFFGLRPVDLSRAVGKDNSSFPGGQRSELGNDDLFWIRVVARREMSALGLETRPWHLDASVLLSFATLPRFALRAARLLRERVSGSGLDYLRRWLR